MLQGSRTRRTHYFSGNVQRYIIYQRYHHEFAIITILLSDNINLKV